MAGAGSGGAGNFQGLEIFISGVKVLDLPLVKAKFHPHVYDINFFILDFASIQAIFCDTCPMSK